MSFGNLVANLESHRLTARVFSELIESNFSLSPSFDQTGQEGFGGFFSLKEGSWGQGARGARVVWG